MIKQIHISGWALVLCTAIAANPVLTEGVWTDLTPPLLKAQITQGNTLTYDVAVDPSQPSTVYVTSTVCSQYAPLWKSTDAGATWNNIGNFNGVTTGVGFGRLRIDPNNSAHLYTCSEIGAAQGFWVSSNGGVSFSQPAGWTTLCQSITEGNFNDVYDMAVDPADFNHILAASRSWLSVIAESNDGGNTWHSIAIPGANGNDYNVIFLSEPSLDIGNSSTWLVTSPAGMWRTANAGATWTKANTPLQAMYHMGYYYARNKALYIGGTPFPLRSTDNGVTWEQITTGLAQFGTYFVIHGDGTNLYTGLTNVWTTPHQGPVYVSSETDGVTWAPYAPTGTAQHIDNGPLAMAYDSVGHIMYSANILGLYALKVPGNTKAENSIQMQHVQKRGNGYHRQIGKSQLKTGNNNNVMYDCRGCVVQSSVNRFGVVLVKN